MIDLLLDNDGDLLIDENGNQLIGESTEQEIALVFQVFPGAFRKAPLIGFGAAARMKGVLIQDKFKRDLDTHLKLDGFSDVTIVIDKENVIQDLRAKR